MPFPTGIQLKKARKMRNTYHSKVRQEVNNYNTKTTLSGGFCIKSFEYYFLASTIAFSTCGGTTS
jgi:hypothetical protein